MIAITIFLFCSSTLSWADTYSITGHGEFSIGYSMGTHKGIIENITGKVNDGPQRPEQNIGLLKMSLYDLKTHKEKMTCHMWEALGLDYKKSDFPEDHVCDSDNKIPSQGKNAVAFPDIQFKISSVDRLDDHTYRLKGTWTIHGHSKEEEVTVKDGKADLSFVLADYGIIVKNFLFISVDDTAHVSLEFNIRKETLTH